MSPPPAKPYRVTHAAISDLGMRRSNNQDAIVTVVDESGAERDRGHFFMVADGMGAHAAGELASKLAVDNVSHTYRKLRDVAPPAALRRAVQNANGLIFDKGQSSPEFHGMGTTCSCLVLLPGAAMVAHVGDSRVYRFRDDTLEQLTFDHSLVWEMAAASHVSADKVPGCIPKNVITRSLGPHETVNVDLEGPTSVAAGDIFLLCSDGLNGVVDDTVIGAMMAAMDPAEAAQTLVDLANLRGGPDNISVIVARVEPAEEPVAEADEPSLNGFGRVHGMSWFGMAACLVAVIGFVAYSHGLGALLAAAGFGASLVIAIMQHATPPSRAAAAPLGGPYGNGPYRRYDCRLGASAVKAVMSVVDELAKIEGRADEQGFGEDLNWGPFQEHRAAAKTANEQGRHADSLRLASEAIRTLMHQVREHRGGEAAG